jgi:2-octaprenyl-6-methoxyphenol hydroxylase
MPEAAIDVLIRGAGPVGCALALALRGSGLSVALQSPVPTRAVFRPLALSYASRLILERIGVWERVAATPIETIHVSQQHGFGRVRMEAGDAGVPALGYVTDYASLLSALEPECRSLIFSNERPARCVVHAEGAAADAGEKRYDQDALVALIATEPPAHGAAFERFTPEGPLALLPFQDRYALVWSCRPQRAAQLLQASVPAFLDALAAATGNRPGRPRGVEARALHPLTLRVRGARVGVREVYIGNAAQTLHPVAGQGLNLGLRDAWELSRIFMQARDPGDAGTLARYAAARRLDAQAAIRLTDGLARTFLGSGRVMRGARGLALTALDIFPGPRRFFARRMIFGSSALP